MKNNTKLKYIILLLVCLNCVGICLYLNFAYQVDMKDDGDSLDSLRDSIKQFETVYDTDTTAEPEVTKDTYTPPETLDVGGDERDTSDEVTARPQVHNPSATLNFDKLWEVNSEIHAWLEIKGTRIDYPILQSKNYDEKYLNTGFDNSYYLGGALFTQSTYNGLDFNDPVTLIYGHTMRSGSMFGRLERTYSDPSSFKEHSDIMIYLPGEVRHYTVFAAVPYDALHILDAYNFSKPYMYRRFFADVKDIRAINANFNEEAFPEVGDRVIILSVCLGENAARRYLVMAVFNEDLADNGIS
ncbi:MAG: class B sortase [Clostridia bacterium]|nr:class B sortase [Clostridia bacterium]